MLILDEVTREREKQVEKTLQEHQIAVEEG